MDRINRRHHFFRRKVVTKRRKKSAQNVHRPDMPPVEPHAEDEGNFGDVSGSDAGDRSNAGDSWDTEDTSGKESQTQSDCDGPQPNVGSDQELANVPSNGDSDMDDFDPLLGAVGPVGDEHVQDMEKPVSQVESDFEPLQLGAGGPLDDGNDDSGSAEEEGAIGPEPLQVKKLSEEELFHNLEVCRLHHRVSIEGMTSIYNMFMRNRDVIAQGYMNDSHPPSYKTIRRKVAQSIPPCKMDVWHIDIVGNNIVNKTGLVSFVHLICKQHLLLDNDPLYKPM